MFRFDISFQIQAVQPPLLVDIFGNNLAGRGHCPEELEIGCIEFSFHWFSCHSERAHGSPLIGQ